MSGVASEDLTKICEDSKTQGFVCSRSCDYLAFCTNTGNQWQTTIIEKCEGGKSCNRDKKTCTKVMLIFLISCIQEHILKR